MGIKSKRVKFTFDERDLKTRPESDDDDVIVTHRALKGSIIECLFCHERVGWSPSLNAYRCHCPSAVRSRQNRADRQKAKAQDQACSEQNRGEW